MGGDSTADPDNPYECKSWKHLVKVLMLREDQLKAFSDLQIDTICVFHGIVGEKDFFQFDDVAVPEERVFPPAQRLSVLHAWKWVDTNRAKIDDDEDDSWFLSNFGKNFYKQVSKAKRAAEAQQQDEEAKRFKTTEPNQASASSFTAGGSRTLQGVALLPPIFHDHLVPEHVKEHFTSKFDAIPNKEEERIIEDFDQSFLIDDLDFIANKFNKVHEQVTTERLWKDGINKSSKRTLGDIGLRGGVATSVSFPQAYFHTDALPQLTGAGSTVDFMVTSIFVCKDSAASPDSGHGEGIANATNAAMSMATIGIPRERIVIPVFTTTGTKVQVAVVYMLEPTLPTVCFVTPCLRMSEREERLKAAKILIAMSHHRNELQQYVVTNNPARVDGMEMRVEKEKYHFKLMRDFFSCCGQYAVSQSFTRMLHVTKPLGNTPYACLPIAVRMADTECRDDDAILFHRLVGYCIGLPHDSTDRQALVSEIERVVSDMHNKGVIHMDLYLSNFMWKKEGESAFSVKIIDFDSCHVVGRLLTDATLLRLKELQSPFFDLGIRATVDHDNRYVTMFKEYIDDEKLRVAGPSEVEANTKKRLDSACFSMICNMFSNLKKST